MDLETLYAQMLVLSGQSFVAGHHETACHLLHAAVHCARDLGDWERLADAGQVARNRQLWLARRPSDHTESFRSLVQKVDEMLQGHTVASRSAGAERRAAARHRVARPSLLPLFALDGQALGVAVADNISATGIRLLVASAHEPGEVLLLEVSRAGLPGTRVAVQVAWCEALDVGFRVAGPFTPPAPPADILALLSGGETEPRRSVP